MDQEILDYIKSQRVCVLCVEMMDGSPHAATVHFASTEDGGLFLFETTAGYRKVEPLQGKPSTRASMVIGSDESSKKTLQMDGEARLMTEAEKGELFDKIYLQKFPEKTKKDADNKFINFLFIPKWWRFTDWTKPQGKVIITSENKTDA